MKNEKKERASLLPSHLQLSFRIKNLNTSLEFLSLERGTFSGSFFFSLFIGAHLFFLPVFPSEKKNSLEVLELFSFCLEVCLGLRKIEEQGMCLPN
jgi:hypothetical protein